MEKSKPKVQVLDVQTEQVLFECELDQSEKAYMFAAEMEEMGLDIKVVEPTLGDTLANSLGVSREQQAEYKADLEHEMESHEGSCCATIKDDKTIH